MGKIIPNKETKGLGNIELPNDVYFKIQHKARSMSKPMTMANYVKKVLIKHAEKL